MTTRIIRRKSLLYRLAYPGEEKAHVSLCPMVLLALGHSLLLLILLGEVAAFAFIIYIYVSLDAILASLLDAGQSLASITLPSIEVMAPAIIVFTPAAVIVFIVKLPAMLRRLETGRLVLEYIKAKRERVCPIYTVV